MIGDHECNEGFPDALAAQHGLDCQHCTYRTVPDHHDIVVACEEVLERGWDYVVPIRVNGVNGVVGFIGPWSCSHDIIRCG